MKRLKIGIRAHDLDNAPFKDFLSLVEEIKKYDLDYLQLVFKKTFTGIDFTAATLSNLENILTNNDIKIAMIGAYFNMLHSKKEKKDNDIKYFKECLKYSSILNCDLVGSETGSYNDDKWTYNSENHTIKAYNEVLRIVNELKDYGCKYHAYPIIEGAYAHTIYNPQLLYKLICDSGIEYVTLDVFNYLNIDNYKNHLNIFDEALQLMKDKIKIFHVKDFCCQDNKLIQVGIGEGLMNYEYIIPKLLKEIPDIILILEGVTKEKIKSSIAYLRRFENEN